MNIGIASLLGTAIGALALASALPAGAESGTPSVATATASACRAQTSADARGRSSASQACISGGTLQVGIIAANRERRTTDKAGARNVPASGPGNTGRSKYQDIGGYY